MHYEHALRTYLPFPSEYFANAQGGRKCDPLQKEQTRPTRTCSGGCGRKHQVFGWLRDSSRATRARHLASFLKRAFDRTRRSGKLLARWHGTTFCSLRSWAISSGGEHYLDTVGVTSSNLVSPTMKDQVIGCFSRWPFLFPKPEGTLGTQSGRTGANPRRPRLQNRRRSPAPANSFPPAEPPCRPPATRIAAERERNRRGRPKRLLRSGAPACRAASDRTAFTGTSARASAPFPSTASR